MATGLSYSKLGQEFSIGGRTVNLIVDYVSRLVIIRLEKTVFPPITQEMWLKNAEEFERRFYFPNCVAAIDKKHFSAMVNFILFKLL
jgi:hypothetical protein